MRHIQGQEFHSIIQNIFGEVKGLNVSDQLQVNCPKCQERDGLSVPDGKFNLEINTKRRLFRCWRCDEPRFSGSLKKIIYLFGSKIDYDLYKSYVSVYGDNYCYDGDEEDEKEHVIVKLPDEMILFSQMEIGNPEHFEAYNYLINERKISRDIIIKYRIGFCIKGKYAKRVIIPSYDNNGMVNYFVARTYDTSNKTKKPYDNPYSDKDKIIFNEGFINWDSTVFLVEGVFDMMSIPNAIPLLGKTLSTTLFNKLRELKPNVIVLLDPDAYKSSTELFYKLNTVYVGCEEKIKIVKLPNNDDLDELRKNYGVDAVIKNLYLARGLTVDDYFIKKLEKLYDRNWGRRYDSNSKYFEWKSNGSKNII